ncbi:hypothetical protein TNCV_2030751 [Trichonephila clavipes]|nr:hypothetical protein TNCV_2030751 [Trichonephila clavipes]
MVCLTPRRKSCAHVHVRAHGTANLPVYLTLDFFSTALNIRRWLPPGAGGSVPPTIRYRMHTVQLRAQEPATGLPLTAQHRARRLAWCHRHRTRTIEWHRPNHTVQLHARVPETGVPLNAQYRARRLAWCHRTWTIERHQVFAQELNSFLSVKE